MSCLFCRTMEISSLTLAVVAGICRGTREPLSSPVIRHSLEWTGRWQCILNARTKRGKWTELNWNLSSVELDLKSVQSDSELKCQFNCIAPTVQSKWTGNSVHFILRSVYSVSQKNPPWGFLTFFPKRLGILVQILHTYYTFLSMLEYKFVFN